MNSEFKINWNEEDLRIYSPTEFEDNDFEALLVPENFDLESNKIAQCFTAYKHVNKKIKPVSTMFLKEVCVRHHMPSNLLESLTPLTKCPAEFVPTSHLTQEQLDMLEINSDKFLSPEEE